MAWKADNSQTSLSVAAYGVTTLDGSAVSADLQGVLLATVSGTAATSVGLANPLPVRGRDGGYVDENGNSDTVGRTFVNAAAATTDVALVALTVGKSIRVLQAAVVNGDSAVALTFNSKGAGAGTAISPLFDNLANGGEVLPYSDIGWFQTNVGEGLTVTTVGGANPVGVIVGYALV